LKQVDAGSPCPYHFLQESAERALGREQRKLPDIVPSDVVGYSKPSADEVVE
jgi:hypothetical protein